MVALVLLQDNKSSKLSGTIAGGSETFLGKHSGKNRDKKLNKYTAILAIAFVVIVFALYLIQPGKARINFGDFDNYFENLENGAYETTAAATTQAPATSESPVVTPTPTVTPEA